MIGFLYILLDTAWAFALMLPWIICFQFFLKKYKLPKLHIAGVYVFCFFLLSIFSATGMPFLFNTHPYLTLNLIPFQDITSNTMQYMLNVFLFMPIGLLLPLLWRRFQSLKTLIGWGFLLSLVIELSQLLCLRASDIDDLLMNTLGAVVGYLLFRLLNGLGKNCLQKFAVDYDNPQNGKVEKPSFLVKWEALIYLAFAWLLMTTVQPFFVNYILQY